MWYRFVQFKKRQKHPWRSDTLSKNTSFIRFLNCANGIKSPKASQMNFNNYEVLLVQSVQNIHCN